MHEFNYNEHSKLAYEHIPVGTSGNAVVGARYRTNIYVIENGARYDMGYVDGKLEEEDVKMRFEEIMTANQEAKYGNERGTLLRRELTPRRERGKIGRARLDRGIKGASILKHK